MFLLLTNLEANVVLIHLPVSLALPKDGGELL
jgi:hypothetical protein